MSIWRTCILSLTLVFGGAADRAGAAEPAPRIVSLSPHITWSLHVCVAGAGDRIVGVDDSSDYPAGVAGIARVGEPAALDVEGLLKLKPTLIVLWDSGTPARGKAELERLHLQLYVTEQRHLDDIGTTLLESASARLAGTEPGGCCGFRPERLPTRARAAAFTACGAPAAQGLLPGVGLAAVHIVGCPCG